MVVRNRGEHATKPSALERGLEEFERGLRDMGQRRPDRVSAHTSYQSKPAEWMVRYLGIRPETIQWSLLEGYRDHVWDGDIDPLQLMLDCLVSGENVGIESGTGTNKTFMAAAILLWFLACFPNSNVITIAPREKQLKLHLWKEVNKFWPRFEVLFPNAQKLGLQIRMRPNDESWTAIGIAVGVGADEEAATKAQGFHAEHMLFITEETPGIVSPIMVAIENTCTAPHNLHLALGNPDHQQDELHKFCEKTTTVHVRISALDHPNVVLDDPSFIAGACSVKSVNARETNYGADSRLYLSRVRGMCPAESTEAVIRWSWCTAARDRDPNRVVKGFDALGVDVANSQNGDKGAVAHGSGAELHEVISVACPDANLFASQTVVPMMRGNRVDEKSVGIDSIGVGAGAVNELLRLGYLGITKLAGSAAPDASEEEEVFGNLRSQMWWQMRLDLQHGMVVFPDDPELFQDLTTPRLFTRSGRIYIESKDELKKRLKRSPDKGDAAVYWNWVRLRRTSVSGRGRMIPL